LSIQRQSADLSDAYSCHDYMHSSHFILFGLKLAVQFAMGSTILIRSGCAHHGNTPICDGEIYQSIAQYAQLFRWFAYGFRSAKSQQPVDASQSKSIREPGERWKEELAMFLTVRGGISSCRLFFAHFLLDRAILRTNLLIYGHMLELLIFGFSCSNACSSSKYTLTS